MKYVLTVLAAMVLGSAISTIPALIAWMAWPYAVPAIFPGAVESGFITAEPGFGPTWVLAILCGAFFKSSPDGGSNVEFRNR